MSYQYFQNEQHQNTRYLAAVGDNGSPDISVYADGFHSAGMKMLHLMRLNVEFESKKNFETLKALKLSLFSEEDLIIYPICFNLRHAIELYLKGIVGHVHTIFELKERAAGRGIDEDGNPIKFDIQSRLNAPNVENGHDLNRLWDFIISLNKSGVNSTEQAWRPYLFDSRYDAFTNVLDAYIKEWGKIDPNGQTFRYPFDNENQRNLVDVGLISLWQLYESAEEFHQKLKEFYEFIAYELLREYENGQFTDVFTWAELIELADDLPDVSTWATDENKHFTDFKINCLNRFNTSNKKLCNAIRYIRNDYLLASKIGYQKPLIALTDDDVQKLLDFFPPHPDLGIADGADVSADTHTDYFSSEAIEARFSSYLNNEEDIAIVEFLRQWEHEKLVDVITLYYLGNGHSDESIHYRKAYASQLKHFDEKDELIRKISEKSKNINHNLKRVLVQLGRTFR